MYYLHVQDFVDAYIGPFTTEQEAKDHYVWCQTHRHDSAVMMGVVTTPPATAFVLTPEDDRNWKEEA